MKRLTTDEFIERAENTHGKHYDYSKTEYTIAKDKVIIICPVHGEFEQLPINHLSGRGCYLCGRKQHQLNRKKSPANFIEESSELHSNKYDYSKVVYTNNYTPVTIVCPTHGEFQQAPHDHTRGRGCILCDSSGFKYDKAAILYYLSINDGELFKIGITNRSVKDRFNKSDLDKITIIKTWDYPLGSDAYTKEQEILKLHKEFKYTGEAILSSGNTELFTTDVLDLGA